MTRQELEDKEQEEYLAEWLRKKRKRKRRNLILGGTKVGEVIKAYKGLNKDMTCRDFQYEEGKITINADFISNLEIKEVDGRKCMVLPVDYVEVNGISTKA